LVEDEWNSSKAPVMKKLAFRGIVRRKKRMNLFAAQRG